MVFDNGTTRHIQQGGDSRGQVWSIDQVNMVATLETNIDLGAFSQSLGSAQLLQNGDFMFQSGNIKAGSMVTVRNAEFSPAGTAVYEFQSTGPSPSYRGWRLPDLYHSTINGSAGPE